MPTGSGTMKNTGECYGHKENESDFWFSGEVIQVPKYTCLFAA